MPMHIRTRATAASVNQTTNADLPVRPAAPWSLRVVADEDWSPCDGMAPDPVRAGSPRVRGSVPVSGSPSPGGSAGLPPWPTGAGEVAPGVEASAGGLAEEGCAGLGTGSADVGRSGGSRSAARDADAGGESRFCRQ